MKSSRKVASASSRPSGSQTGKSYNSVSVMSFDEALNCAHGTGNKHLMLGNGFSIALFPSIFSYNTLFEKAKAAQRLSHEVMEVFRSLETTDFEIAIEALERAAALISAYEQANPKLTKQLANDAARLRDVLAETIAENHPARPFEVTESQYASCRRFLAKFDGCIYTVNYDLLLYWSLMQSEILPKVASDDGFRNSENASEQYVVWDVQNTNDQRIYYLHGALHVYDAGAELLKFTWSKTDIPLVDQIKQSLTRREYPLIVTEGTSKQKKARIQHSNFLGRAYRSFSAIKGSLFIYGHSLAENDNHLLKLIDKGRTQKIFVGLYGDPNSDSNRDAVARANQFSSQRNSKNLASVYFFDAETARVWDGESPPIRPKANNVKPRAK